MASDVTGALRLPYQTLSAASFKGMRDTKQALAQSPLGLALVELIYLRVSQLNGCAFCLEMHAKALRARGEPQERLDALAGWHASTRFSARERAALQWADALTHIAQTHAPDADFDALRAHFSDAEISDLTLSISSMNALNRVAIAMRQ
jgi:uncharacterized peroxidase-related enzyme